MRLLWNIIAASAYLVITPAHAIVNGATDQGHPATVMISAFGNMHCSGTLITPQVVVTARHCFYDDQAKQAYALDGMTVHFGAQPGEGIAIVDARWREDADLAVIKIASPAQPEPVQLIARPAYEYEGQMLHIVGYGDTFQGAGDAGTKRAGTIELENVLPKKRQGTVLHYIARAGGNATCNGDSGGSAYLEVDGQLVLAGAISFGQDRACSDGSQGSVSVADYIVWVVDAASELDPGGYPFDNPHYERRKWGEPNLGCQSDDRLGMLLILLVAAIAWRWRCSATARRACYNRG